MKRGGAIVALAGLLWAAGVLGDRPLEAASITVLEDNGNTVFNNSNVPDEVDIDVDWNTNLPVRLEVLLESGDTGTTAAFSGFHIDLTGIAWRAFHVELEGGPTWEAVSQVIPGATGGLASVEVETTRVGLSFGPPIEDFDVLILGEPNDAIDPGLDWAIALGGLGPGQSFRIQLQPTPVPEPATLALAGTAAAAGLGAAWRRRRRGTSA